MQIVVLSVLAPLVFVGCMVQAARTDMLHMTVSNRISLILVASYVAVACVSEITPLMLGLNLAGAAMVFAGGFYLFVRGWMGGGDVKLAAATALCLGAEQIAPYLLLSAVIGSVLTLGLLLLRRFPLAEGLADKTWALRLHRPETGVPYGIALALAGLALLPRATWMQGLPF